MSLAAQTSDIVNVLAQTRELRRQALGHIRSETARHLREARSAHRRMAKSQQQQLAEAVRGTKLATAILLGAADEKVDGYRKARLRQAASLDRALADGFKSLRKDTRKWRDTQFALRRRQASEDLRERRRARAALHKDVQSLTARSLAFLAGLTADRQQASATWVGRGAVLDLPRVSAAPLAAFSTTASVSTVLTSPPLAAETIKAESVMPDLPTPAPTAKAESQAPEVKASEVKASEPREGKEVKESKAEGKSSGGKGERGEHGKSA